jgi:hypothetical protein
VVEHVDGTAFEDGLGEQEQGHVGTTPRAIHGEEAQAGGGQAVQVAVGVGHQLVGLLGGGVDAHRVVHAVVLGERHLGVAAVHAGAARIHQVLDLAVATAFQDVHEADQVALHIGLGIDQRVAHAGLGGQVDDLVELLFGKELLHAFVVRHVHFHETEVLVGRQAGQAVVLELDFVIVIEVVETNHLIASCQQELAGVHADKTGCAGNENFHGRGDA